MKNLHQEKFDIIPVVKVNIKVAEQWHYEKSF